MGGNITAWQLWRADGTAAGTVPLTDVIATIGGQLPDRPVGLNGDAFFLAPEEGVGVGLWGADGTTGAVQRILAPDPGVGNAAIGDLTALNGSLYFTTTTAAAGSEVWRSDGTVAGTAPVADLEPGPGGSHPSGFAAVGSDVVWLATTTAEGQALRRTGPTGPEVAATFAVPSPTGSSGSLFTQGNQIGVEFADAVYFGLSADGLWRSDGTAAGTARVSRAPADPRQLTVFNGALYFVAGSAAAGRELWRSDGTPGGTAVLADVYPGPIGSNINSLTIAGGLLYFKANHPDTGIELWVSDGTPAGTRILASGPGPSWW